MRALVKGEVIPRDFYVRDPSVVARELLGKVLVRDYGGVRLSGLIVEVEAYFGSEDPASRARRGGDLRRVLYGECGVALVYGIHTHWMLNAVAHEPGHGGAVLFRAIRPLEGVEVMRRLRGLSPDTPDTLIASGPGRLTRALGVDKAFHRKPLYVARPGGLWIEDCGTVVKDDAVVRGFRVGVREDLPTPYRFMIRGSPYVSRARGGRPKQPST